MKQAIDRYTCSRCGTTEELAHSVSREAPNDWLILTSTTELRPRSMAHMLCWSCRLSFGEFIRGFAVDKAVTP